MHFFLPFSQTFFRTVVHKFCIPATYSVKYVSLSIKFTKQKNREIATVKNKFSC